MTIILKPLPDHSQRPQAGPLSYGQRLGLSFEGFCAKLAVLKKA
jgi:hypothetical protein